MAIEEHPCMIPANPDNVLLRYIDLEKFQDMLETSSLFFCRADKFSDPFEGSLTKNDYDWRKKQSWELNWYGNQHLNLKKFTLINCWHINEYESDAMWRLYLKTNEGVAIQTTVGKLCSALNKSESKFRVSKVRYINYEREIWYDKNDYPQTAYNFYIPLVHKRIEFCHENEFRILHDIEYQDQIPDYWDNEPFSIGKKIKIDLSKMIDKIILPPTSDAEVRLKVESILNKFGYQIEICNSKLMNDPYY
jgi:hypothetical protein